MAPMGYPQAAPQQYGAVPPGYVPPTAYAGVPPTAVATVYAGFWMRVGAHLLDLVILAIPATLLSFMFIFGFVVEIVGAWLYFALQESSEYQATLGKRALKIYVTDLQGRRLTFGQATGRYFAKIISTITLGIGYIMVGFTQKKQGLHDMIAGTLVLRK
jgi:uncharacterized RDD family membrane protein YckC